MSVAVFLRGVSDAVPRAARGQFKRELRNEVFYVRSWCFQAWWGDVVLHWCSGGGSAIVRLRLGARVEKVCLVAD